MADASYQPKIYRKAGGTEFVIASGGQIKIETGGKIVPDSGTQAAAITDQTTAIVAGGTGAAAGGWDTAANRDTSITAMNDIRTKLNAVLAALRGAGIIVT